MSANLIALSLVRHLVRLAFLEPADIVAIADDLDASGAVAEAHLVRLALVEGLTSVPEDLAAIKGLATPPADGGNEPD